MSDSLNSWIARGHAGKLARSRQIEALVHRLVPIHGDDWGAMARTAIAEGYYPPDTHVGNVATTLRTAAKRLGAENPTTQRLRDKCATIGSWLSALPARQAGEPRAAALRAAYDLLEVIVHEDLVKDEEDPDWALFKAMGLLAEKLSTTRYRTE